MLCFLYQADVAGFFCVYASCSHSSFLPAPLSCPSPQNTVESQKVLEKLNAAKAAAEGSVGKAMEDENKQAQVITAKL